jgi:hypothetical protein
MAPTFEDAATANEERWTGGSVEIANAALAGFLPPSYLVMDQPKQLNDVIASHVGRAHAPLLSCRTGPGGEISALLIAAVFDLTSEDLLQMRLHVLHDPLLRELASGSRVSGESPEMQVIVPEVGRHVVSVACINADTDPQQEVVILTAPGADAQGGLGSDAYLAIHVLDADPIGRLPATLPQPQRTLALSAADSAPLGLLGGDVNGDGVDDLIVGSGSVLRILHGVPVLK